MWTFVSVANWQRRRLRVLCDINPPRTPLTAPSQNGTVSFLPMELARANDPKFTVIPKPFVEVSSGYTAFQEGDVLIAKITPCFENGKGGIARDLESGVGFGSTEFHVLRPGPELDAKFLYYVTISRPFREAGTMMMKGSAGQQRVPTDFLSNFILPFPPKCEQQRIGQFLDAFNVYIRRLVRLKKKRIRLLAENKEGMILRAVTRGIRPGTSYRDSGVDWLGSIPSHWEVHRNLHVFSERVSRGTMGLPILAVSLRNGVTAPDAKTVDGRPRRQIENIAMYKLALKDDLTYNMMRMWQGALGVVPVDGLVSPAYVVARPRQGMNSHYFALLYRTSVYMNEVNRNSRGIVSDRNRLYWQDFKRLVSPVPPTDEQAEIVSFVDAKSNNIDQAIAKAEREVKLILEYRDRIIADVVTGYLGIPDQLGELLLPGEWDDVAESDDPTEAEEELEDEAED